MKRLFIWLFGIGIVASVLSGCSLALDTQKEISIPLKTGEFYINANVSFGPAQGFVQDLQEQEE